MEPYPYNLCLRTLGFCFDRWPRGARFAPICPCLHLAHRHFCKRMARHLSSRDVDFRTHVVRVTRKLLYGSNQRIKEEREEVSVSASLIAALKKYKASQKTEYRRARVSQRIRRTRQATRVQDQAGSEGPYCSNFFFHKFRQTCDAQPTRSRLRISKRLQNWMGYKDLASTMVDL